MGQGCLGGGGEGQVNLQLGAGVGTQGPYMVWVFTAWCGSCGIWLGWGVVCTVCGQGHSELDSPALRELSGCRKKVGFHMSLVSSDLIIF